MGILIDLFGGYLVDHGRFGSMGFLTERSAQRYIRGGGLAGIDPYRRNLAVGARPEFVPGILTRREERS